MEDVAPSEQGDQLAGCTDRARRARDRPGRRAARADVGRGARTGRADRLADRAQRRTQRDADVAVRSHLAGLRRAVRRPALGRRPGDRRPLVEHYPTYFEHVSAWAERHDAWAVTHGDYRLDNVLFGDGVRSPAVTVVDWQTSGGSGPVDVAYFCGAGSAARGREEHERALVHRYAPGLRAAGVDVSDEAAWDGYVLGAASGYLSADRLAAGRADRRGDDMFVAMASRHAHQIRTVGLLDVLGLDGGGLVIHRSTTTRSTSRPYRCCTSAPIRPNAYDRYFFNGFPAAGAERRRPVLRHCLRRLSEQGRDGRVVQRGARRSCSTTCAPRARPGRPHADHRRPRHGRGDRTDARASCGRRPLTRRERGPHDHRDLAGDRGAGFVALGGHPAGVRLHPHHPVRSLVGVDRHRRRTHRDRRKGGQRLRRCA